jgi:transcriptional regulator of NAD metabolism
MTTQEQKQIIKFIKEYVDIKIETQVAKEFQKLLSETKTKPTKKPVSTFKEMMRIEDNTINHKKPANFNTNTNTKKPLPVNTKNPMFNNILQETYNEGNWQNIQAGGETFTANMAQSWPSMKQNIPVVNMNEDGEPLVASANIPSLNQVFQKRKNNINEMIPEDLKGKVDTNAIPSFLQNALTKTYKVDNYKKKGGLPEF